MPLDKDLPTRAFAFDPLAGSRGELASEARAGALGRGDDASGGGLHVEDVGLGAVVRGEARSRLYRLRPSPCLEYRPARLGQWRSPPFGEPASPNRLCWGALPFPDGSADFLDGMVTIGGAGDIALRLGVSIHIYRANRSMTDRYFFNADGELLVAPQQGDLAIRTEFGDLRVGPMQFAVIPRGVRFSVDLLDGPVRGFVCENYGAPLRPSSSSPAEGLEAIALQAPKAAFEDRPGPVELVAKLDGGFWTTELASSPLDAVAWHGGYFPYKGDLSGLTTPGLYRLLTSPRRQGPNLDLDIIAGAARAPGAQRTATSRYVGQICAADAQAGLPPGGGSLSVGLGGFDAVPAGELGLALVIETSLWLRPTRFALSTPALQRAPSGRAPTPSIFPTASH